VIDADGKLIFCAVEKLKVDGFLVKIYDLLECKSDCFYLIAKASSRRLTRMPMKLGNKEFT